MVSLYHKSGCFASKGRDSAVHVANWRRIVMETKTCVLIADIDEDFRRLLGDVLSQEDDMECVGNTDNGVEALTLAAERQPDVLVMDLVLLKLDGIEVLRRLPEACPGAKAIVVTHLYRNEIVRQCTALGAAYFVPSLATLPHFWIASARSARCRVRRRCFCLRARATQISKRQSPRSSTRSAFRRT